MSDRVKERKDRLGSDCNPTAHLAPEAELPNDKLASIAPLHIAKHVAYTLRMTMGFQASLLHCCGKEAVVFVSSEEGGRCGRCLVMGSNSSECPCLVFVAPAVKS